MNATRFPGPDKLSRSVCMAGFITFTLIGAVQATYGPSMPALRTGFALSVAGAGVVFGALGAGAVVGALVTATVAQRISLRVRLAGGTSILALGCVGVSFAPTWPLLLALATVQGIGIGVTVAGYTVAFASGFGRRSTAMLTLLNGFVGIGSVVAPLIVSALPQTGYRIIFFGSAAVLAGTLPASRSARTVARSRMLPAPTGGHRFAAAFSTLLFLYTGTEQAVNAWTTTQLLGDGFSLAAAVAGPALFWGALTVGRTAGAAITLRVSEPRLVVGALGCSVTALTFGAATHLYLLSYLLLGLAMAPVFPATMVWFTRWFPDATTAPNILYASALFGSMVVPVVLGPVFGWLGLRALPVVLSALAIAALSLAISLWKVGAVRDCRASSDPPAAGTMRTAHAAALSALPRSPRGPRSERCVTGSATRTRTSRMTQRS